MKVLLAGGGTGGHVYPMLAVGGALQRHPHGVTTVYVGTRRGMEGQAVKRHGGRIEFLDVEPLRGGGLKQFVRGAYRASASLPQATALIRSEKPDVVFSVGGYAAGPVTLAARVLGIPVTLLEPNAVVGLTNRWLSRLVTRAYVCFPETLAAFPSGRAVFSGVPLRGEFEPAPYPPVRPKDGGRGDSDTVSVLVMGGSQGAASLNQTVPKALLKCAKRGLKLRVLHQAGRGKEAAATSAYGNRPEIDVEVVTFIDDVAAALRDADLVIERAGAGSLAELCAVGRPGVLVPFPFAADDHQTANAQSLARQGAALCVPQDRMTERELCELLLPLLKDESKRSRMAERALLRGRPGAAAAIADDLLRLSQNALSGRHDVDADGFSSRHGAAPKTVERHAVSLNALESWS